MANYRKSVRISLRSALLITTIVCLWLGRQTHVRKLQANALSHIRELGGMIQNEATQPSFFHSLVKHKSSIDSRHVTSVAFLGPEFSDSDISEFARFALVLPRLERVMLTDTLITVFGEQDLRKRLPDLEISVVSLIDSQGSTHQRH